MTDEKPRGRLSRMRERLQQIPGPTPEELAEFKEERTEREGTMLEWAQMQENGEITVRITDYSTGGGHGTGGFSLKPSDEKYESCKKEYGLEKPGDTRHIKKRWNGTEFRTERNYLTNSDES